MIVGWNALAFMFYHWYYNDLKMNKEESLGKNVKFD